LGLVFSGLNQVDLHKLLRATPSYAFFALPILIVSFGYHNMIPTLTAYMKGDLKRVKMTIIVGSLLTLFIYIIWEIIVLGIVPLEGEYGILSSYKNERDGAQAIAGIVGSSWVSVCAQGFALFAILTSFIAQTLSLVHFLADGFKIKHEKKENIWLCLAALLPPLLMAYIYPKVFLSALSFGGGIAAILFGIIPVLMVWIGRYRKHSSSPYQVFGGRPLLLVILLFALLIFVFQISNMAGASFLPRP